MGRHSTFQHARTKASRALALLTSVVLVAAAAVAGGIGASTPAAAAEGDAAFLMTKQALAIDGDGLSGPLGPGDDFLYQINISCSAPVVGIQGCSDAQLVDLLPEWIEYVGDVVIAPATTQGTASTAVVDGRDQLTVDFTSNDLAGGFPVGGGATLTFQARVSADIPVDLDGATLVNTAVIDGSNAFAKEAPAPITVAVPFSPSASVDKFFSPEGAPAAAGTPTTVTLVGTNTSNGGVDTLVVQDPVADPPPTDSSSPFHHLAVQSFGPGFVMPAGADTVQVEVYTAADGWQTVSTGATPSFGAAALADVRGVRLTFSSTTGMIDRAAAATIPIVLEQRENVSDIVTTTVVTDTVVSGVTRGEDSAPSAPDSATYTILPYAVQVEAGKAFAPDQIAAGDPTTVTLSVENAGSVTLGSMTITEPSPGLSPNPLAGPLTFTGFGTVQWPAGATSADVAIRYDSGPDQVVTGIAAGGAFPTADPDRRVIGFTTTFRGAFVSTAEGRVPFTATTVGGPSAPTVATSLNRVDVAGTALDDPSKGDTDSAEDTLTMHGEKIAVSVGKTITPGERWLVPGQTSVAQLPATVQAFPATTVNPTEIVVEDSIVNSPDWWDLNDAAAITQLGIPAGTSLTIQYRTAAGAWVALPGVPSPLTIADQFFSFEIPTALRNDLTGLRFTYTNPAGYAQGTTVQPNVSFVTRAATRAAGTPIGDLVPDWPVAAPEVVRVENCAAASASRATLSGSATTDPCPVLDLRPTDGTGTYDLLDKTWTPTEVNERSGSVTDVRLNWSTGGLTGVAEQSVEDTGRAGTPADADNPVALAQTAFNAFDLTRIQPITTGTDPLIRYDRITRIELYNSVTEQWVPITVGGSTSWDGSVLCAATPGTCTVFPGYTLSTTGPDGGERATTTAVRFFFAEGDNRAAVVAGNPTAPQPGTGVASSAGNSRAISLQFTIRDTRRSDGTPVLAGELYNTGTASLVGDTARSQACGAPYAGAPLTCADQLAFDSAFDDIVILNVTSTIATSKSWTGGPIGVPPAGTAIADYPSTQATITVRNQGPVVVDSLRLADPAPDSASPYEQFDLIRIVSVNEPTAGSPTTRVVLTVASGANPCPVATPCTIAAATALTATDLQHVVGIEAISTGRIPAASTGATSRLSVVVDLRLRQTLRTAGTPIVPTGVTNTVLGELKDPAVEPAGSCATSDPAGQPSANAVIQCASASIQIQGTQTRTVTASKAFTPALQYEDQDALVRMTLSGTPGGNARSNEVTLSDTAATFWNAYDFAGLSTSGGSQFAIASPANRVKIEVLVGATYSVAGTQASSTITGPTGGTWYEVHEVGTPGNSWLTAAQARAALPENGDASTPIGVVAGPSGGVAYGDVVGIRFTYQNRVGGAPVILENPASPTLTAQVMIQRRDTLRQALGADDEPSTTVPVPSTLAGNHPAPGETAAGVASNEVAVRASGPNADPASNTDDEPMRFLHRPTAVTVTKTPVGEQSPAVVIPFTIRFANTGSWPIIDPVITDAFPLGISGEPLLVFAEGVDPAASSTYTYALTGGTPPPSPSTAMPTSAGVVVVAPTTNGAGEPTGLSFSFPAGSAIGVGQTYSITIPLLFRPGVVQGQTLTNATSIDGERLFDTCVGLGGTTTSVETCANQATVAVRPAASIRVTQSVKADDPALGAVNDLDPALPCVAGADGFYTGACVPITKPADSNIWRLRFLNDGTYPLDTVRSIDYLPQVGPSGVLSDNTVNLSEWTGPLGSLLGPPTLIGAPADATLTTYAFVGGKADLCEAVLFGSSCAAGDWVPLSSIADLSTVTALYFVVALPTPLQPGQGYGIEIRTKAPVSSPTAGSDTVTWNSVAASATRVGSSSFLLPREPNVVGAALATGSLTIRKQLAGDAQGEGWVPETFTGGLTCAVGDEPVPAADLPGVPTLISGEPAIEIDGVPWGAVCSFDEDFAGAVVTATDATVVSDGTPGGVVVTNRYDYADIAVTKTVATAAVDQDGLPIGYGPFDFTISCELAEGDVVLWEESHSFTLEDGETWRWTDDHDAPPALATCSLAEDDDKGALSVEVELTIGDDDPIVEPLDELGEFDLAADDGDAPANLAVVENAFGVGSLELTKTVIDPDGRYGDGPFTVQVTCTLVDDSHPAPGIVVWNDAITLPIAGATSDDPPVWTTTIDNIAAGAVCVVEETATGAATEVTYSPAEVDTVGIGIEADETAEVEVTNEFVLGSIQIDKSIVSELPDVYGVGPFEVQLECVYDKDGTPTQITWDGAERLAIELAAPDYTATVDDLLVGAECAIVDETLDGGATEVDLGDSVIVVEGDATEDTTITVTNTYVIDALLIEKQRVGTGAAKYGDGPFTAQVTCTWLPDGVATPIELPAGGVVTLSSDNDYRAQIDGLIVGASCLVVETNAGAATDSWTDPVDGRIEIVESSLLTPSARVVIVNEFDLSKLESTGSSFDVATIARIALLLLLVGATALAVVRIRRRA